MEVGDVVAIQRAENGWIVSGPGERPRVIVASDNMESLAGAVEALCYREVQADGMHPLTERVKDALKPRPEGFKAI